MDSDGEGNEEDFAKQGGDALNLEDGGNFANDSEEVDPEDEEDVNQEEQKASGGKGANLAGKDVKGENLEVTPEELSKKKKHSSF